MRLRKFKVRRVPFRKPGGKRRMPLPVPRSRVRRKTSGRADAPMVTAHIRALGVDAGTDERAHIRRKLGMKFGKFARSIERVSVRIEDTNGPRGGLGQICRIKVVLTGLPSIIVEKRDTTHLAAFDGALAGAQRAVRRSLQRRRMKPLKHPPG